MACPEVPPILGSQQQEGCISWPRTESSGGCLGMSQRHHWLSTRRCSGRPLLLFVPRHHMTPSVHQLPKLSIRESGLPGSMGWVQRRAFEDTHWHTAMAPSLPISCGAAIIPPPPASSTHPPGPRHSIQSVPRQHSKAAAYILANAQPCVTAP